MPIKDDCQCPPPPGTYTEMTNITFPYLSANLPKSRIYTFAFPYHLNIFKTFSYTFCRILLSKRNDHQWPVPVSSGHIHRNYERNIPYTSWKFCLNQELIPSLPIPPEYLQTIIIYILQDIIVQTKRSPMTSTCVLRAHTPKLRTQHSFNNLPTCLNQELITIASHTTWISSKNVCFHIQDIIVQNHQCLVPKSSWQIHRNDKCDIPLTICQFA